MDKEDLRAIQKIVKEEIKPIKVDLDSVKGGLDSVKGDLGEIKGTVDANNASLISIENTIGVYKDALDIERKRVNKHDEHLEIIEGSLDLKP